MSSKYFNRIFIACISLIAIVSPAFAHVKWFSPYDTRLPPLGVSEVTSISHFWLVFILSYAFIFFMVLMDAKTVTINRYIDVYRYKALRRLPDDFAYRVFTLTLIIFFSCVWAIGGITLTPELKHSSTLIAAIQVLTIVALMTRKTAKYSGFGIIALWGFGISNYGFFHLADYMIFLGIAIFMIKAHKTSQFHAKAVSFFILYLAISWTLQWASVEKWIYPSWSYPLLEEKPHLTMGIAKETFMVMAGFVEFTLAFLLIALTGTGFIVTTLALAGVFILAIIDFGKVDAIGHLAIIVSLYLMAIMGPSRLNYYFAGFGNDPVKRAFNVSLCYLVALLFFTAIYYGLQKIAG